MRWRRAWPEPQARPRARTLTGDQQKKLLGTMIREIAASPVLTGLGLRVRTRRGRFYLERRYAAGGAEVTLSWGRITPLADPPTLLLEQERGMGLWSKIAQGSGRKLMKLIAGDTRGTFHGPGALDQALRTANQGLVRLPVERQGRVSSMPRPAPHARPRRPSSTISACLARPSSNRRSGTRIIGSPPSSRRAQTGPGCWCGSGP